MSLIQQIFTDLLQLLFPRNCNACGTALFYGEKTICIKCLHDLPFTDFHLYNDHPAAKLFWGRIRVHQVTALLYFKKGNRVQQLIHQLKYKGQTDVGFLLGKRIGENIIRSGQKPDLIIPIPLHPKKERSRGYNQSQSIAEGIACILQIPIQTKLLTRKINTATQTKKSRFNRFENIKDAFELHKTQDLQHKHILLVDDILTTGATFEACGKLLLDNGLNKLSIATLAYAE